MNNSHRLDWPESLLPRPEQSEVAIAPPGTGPGYWAGAPSAAIGDDGIYLAYRLRRPIDAGRGYAVHVARSADGVRFDTVMSITRDQFASELIDVAERQRTDIGGEHADGADAVVRSPIRDVDRVADDRERFDGRADRSAVGPPARRSTRRAGAPRTR